MFASIQRTRGVGDEEARDRATEGRGCVAWDVSINDVREEEAHAIAEQHDHVTHDLC